MAVTIAVLHALRIKGFASVGAITCFLGPPVTGDAIDAALTDLAGDGLVHFRTGRFEAWTLTPAGRAAHAELLAADEPPGEVLRDVHRRFVVLDLPFKQLCTDWQLEGRSAGRERRFDELHTQVSAVVLAAGEARPRMTAYGPRLVDAHRRVTTGDDSALTRPLSESYHDVWMELHQDLLVTLGIERTAADGS